MMSSPAVSGVRGAVLPWSLQDVADLMPSFPQGRAGRSLQALLYLRVYPADHGCGALELQQAIAEHCLLELSSSLPNPACRLQALINNKTSLQPSEELAARGHMGLYSISCLLTVWASCWRNAAGHTLSGPPFLLAPPLR